MKRILKINILVACFLFFFFACNHKNKVEMEIMSCYTIMPEEANSRQNIIKSGDNIDGILIIRAKSSIKTKILSSNFEFKGLQKGIVSFKLIPTDSVLIRKNKDFYIVLGITNNSKKNRYKKRFDLSPILNKYHLRYFSDNNEIIIPKNKLFSEESVFKSFSVDDITSEIVKIRNR